MIWKSSGRLEIKALLSTAIDEGERRDRFSYFNRPILVYGDRIANAAMDGRFWDGGGFFITDEWSAYAKMKFRDIDWTEAARAAARLAQAAGKAVGKAVENLAGNENKPDVMTRWAMSLGEDFPYKVATYDPATQKYNVIAAKSSFIKAYNYHGGTHVMQTHGTAAQVEQQASGAVSGPGAGENMAARAAGGFLVSGPTGAAIGALSARGKMYELPTPVITPKKLEVCNRTSN